MMVHPNAHKRIKQIVKLAVHDFHNHGYSINQSDEELISWLCDEMLKHQGIEDLSTIEITLMVLEKLKSLDIVDLEFIHEIFFKSYCAPSGVNVSLSLKVGAV